MTSSQQEITRILLLFSMVFVGLSSNSGIAADSSSLMSISKDGTLLACSNRDNGTVTIVNLQTHKKMFEIEVGHHPEGVSFIGNTHLIATAVYDDDFIIFLDADTGQRTGKTDVYDEPYGVISNQEGTQIYVTLDYPGRVVEIDVASRKINREITVGKFLRGLAISGDQSELYTLEYYTGNLFSIDRLTGKVEKKWEGGRNDNLARHVALHPKRSKAYIPHIRSRITVAHGAGSIFPILSVIDTNIPGGKKRARIPMDSFIGTRVTSNPWETAITPDGKTLFVVFSGN